MPDTQMSDTSSIKGSLLPKPTSSDYKDTRTLADSFERFIRYSNEYADENPLLGEPGSFAISRSKEKPVSHPPSQLEQVQTATKTTPAATPPPLEVKTDIPSVSGKKTGTLTGGAKSPVTPGTGKDKQKRRKSKAPGSGVP